MDYINFDEIQSSMARYIANGGGSNLFNITYPKLIKEQLIIKKLVLESDIFITSDTISIKDITFIKINEQSNITEDSYYLHYYSSYKNMVKDINDYLLRYKMEIILDG